MSNQNIFIKVDIEHVPVVSWLDPISPTTCDIFGTPQLDICGDNSEYEVDCIVNEIINNSEIVSKIDSEEYPEKDIKKIIKALITEMNIDDPEEYLIMNGGLHFKGETVDIYTGCCCDMNAWVKMSNCLKIGHSTWMGHDPSLYLDSKDDIMWSIESSYDGSIYEDQKIYYNKDEFIKYLDKLKDDFDGFVNGPLSNRIQEICPELADDFIKAFRHCFSDPRYI